MVKMAVSYGLLSYLTAYLKTHYTIYFMAACLIAKREDTGKIGVFINECNRLGIKVCPPSVNRSGIDFIPNKKTNKILFGLGAIKGIGDEVAKQIIASRPYTSLDDFLSRVNDGKPGTKNVCQLIKAGAIPAKDKSDMLLRYADILFEADYKDPVFKELASLPKLSILESEWGIDCKTVKDKTERLQLYNTKRKQKFDSERVFRLTEKEKKRNAFIEAFKQKYMDSPHMWEFETLSMFLTEDPLKDASQYISRTFESAEDGDELTVLSVIVDIQKKKDKRGGQFAYLHLYTTNGIIEAICWSSQYNRFANLIAKGKDVAILGKKKEDSFVVKEMKPYQQWLIDRKLVKKGA